MLHYLKKHSLAGMLVILVVGAFGYQAGSTLWKTSVIAVPTADQCGNGTLEGTEECDDNNLINGDGCSSSCTIEETDQDNDGVSDSEDNCPNDANPGQEDMDNDGIGDTCDPQNDTDTDGDGVIDSNDLCPATEGESTVDENGCADVQVDVDGDGVCDPQAASEGPSTCTGSDNCPEVANTDQADEDDDGLGDACDEAEITDADNDGVVDDVDTCLGTVIPEENVPSEKLKSNRYALTNEDVVFDSYHSSEEDDDDFKGMDEKKYSLDGSVGKSTSGCSCEQIIAKLSLGEGHSKYGCSLSAMKCAADGFDPESEHCEGKGNVDNDTDKGDDDNEDEGKNDKKDKDHNDDDKDKKQPVNKSYDWFKRFKFYWRK